MKSSSAQGAESFEAFEEEEQLDLKAGDHAAGAMRHLLTMCLWIQGVKHVMHGACSSITDSLRIH